MAEKRIDIRSKEGFSIYIKLLAVVFIVVTFLIISDYPAIAAVLSFICLLILTARSGVEIDRNKKTYQEYMVFFFVIKVGKPVPFDAIDHLYLSSEQVLKETTLATSKKDIIHSLNLKFKNGETIRLMDDKDKRPLLKKAEVLSKKMGTPVIES